jgi:hypothetical protein
MSKNKVNNSKVNSSIKQSVINAPNHHTLIKQLKKNLDIKLKSYDRILKVNTSVDQTSDGITTDTHNGLTTTKDVFLSSSIKLSPEAFGFLFHVDGCKKNLLFYIIQHQVDFRITTKAVESKKVNTNATVDETLDDVIELKTKKRTQLNYRENINQCRYKFDNLTIKQFIEYSKEIFDTVYKINTVKQAHRDLVDMNITSSELRTKYFLNPLFIDFRNDANKRNLANQYCKLLIKKGEDLFLGFYPVYKKTK